jgi:hypothetical protein
MRAFALRLIMRSWTYFSKYTKSTIASPCRDRRRVVALGVTLGVKVIMRSGLP